MRAPTLTLLLAAGFVLAACADGPMGPGEADSVGTAATNAAPTDASPLLAAARRRSGVQSFDFQDVDARCSNSDPDHEPILLEGTFTQHYHRVWTDSDWWNFVSNYEISGTGVGLTSGAAYTLHGEGTYGVHIGPDAIGALPYVEREVSTFLIRGEGSVPDQIEKYGFNVTVDPDGDLVVLAETFELSCQ
ncbi:MAG: hypothetical protein PVF05_08475 [Gemmatimonadales bacterium]|jgi:hypothetical protein